MPLLPLPDTAWQISCEQIVPYFKIYQLICHQARNTSSHKLRLINNPQKS